VHDGGFTAHGHISCLLTHHFSGTNDSKQMRIGVRSDLIGGPERLEIQGTLWKKGQRLGWSKRYMRVDNDTFTYYSKAADSFPLGYFSLGNVIDIIEDPKSKRSFDIICREQTFKLLAHSKDECEIWVDTIDAIMEHRRRKTLKSPTFSRRKIEVPKWKKCFWQSSLDDKASAENFMERRDSLLAEGMSDLYREALGMPRLMKKLITTYNDDAKALKLLISVIISKVGHKIQKLRKYSPHTSSRSPPRSSNMKMLSLSPKSSLITNFRTSKLEIESPKHLLSSQIACNSTVNPSRRIHRRKGIGESLKCVSSKSYGFLVSDGEESTRSVCRRRKKADLFGNSSEFSSKFVSELKSTNSERRSCTESGKWYCYNRKMIKGNEEVASVSATKDLNLDAMLNNRKSVKYQFELYLNASNQVIWVN